jgi:hypothetical protein
VPVLWVCLVHLNDVNHEGWHNLAECCQQCRRLRVSVSAVCGADLMLVGSTAVPVATALRLSLQLAAHGVGFVSCLCASTAAWLRNVLGNLALMSRVVAPAGFD